MPRDDRATCLDATTTGMALSVTAEVGRLLEALAASGQPGAVDLRSLPLTDADRQQLQDLLGRGEVRADLELAGRSEVWETAYPGVWWVRHLGADDRIASEEIAVCPVPEILQAHPDDIRAGARRLSQDLAALQAPAAPVPGDTNQETTHV
jgi:hydrogenase-1 operon protein HyaF